MEYIGYIKYQGPYIKDGLFGAREAAIALNGFDEVFRYFLTKEEPEFAKLKYDLPVKIREGSWEIATPENIADLITVKNAVGGLVLATLTTYFTKSAAIAAKDGLLNTPAVKDVSAIFRKTFQTIQWVIRLVSHMKEFRKKFEHAKIEKDEFISIRNADGEELKVPLAILLFMEKCPANLFSDLASIVSPTQELEIGVNIDGQIETAKITEATRRIFYVEDDDKEEILPELIDGDEVTLTGVVTRANESAQSIGFAFNDHIITCKPETGKSLADFKHALISQNHKHLYVPQMKLTGVVERRTPSGEDKDRVRIFFSKLEPEDAPEEQESHTPDLLPSEEISE